MKFVEIPPGEFQMGCSPGDGECYDREKPAHQVRITKGFEIGKYEVTQAEWEAVMGSNPSGFKGADRPVERVSWNDIQGFLEKLNGRNDGYHYRLPTEAEWEYAARAGATDARYGYDADEVGWYGNNSGRKRLDAEKLGERDSNDYAVQIVANGNATHPVGEKQPNAWGLYDMLGNVWEWCQDWYAQGYYQSSLRTDPKGPSSGKYHILRGGSWYYSALDLRVSNRVGYGPGDGDNGSGFRCAREQK